jgi:replication-associated protein repA
MFDYFYGQSGEMFSYFRVPKILFRDIKFKDLSTDAKTLYGILLDRMGLSVKNGWLDEQGRVYIIFPVQEVMDALGCADNKATKLFRELEKFGLIERKRRGLGKPNLIYVKNFADPRFRNREKNGSGAADSAQPEAAKSRGNKTEWNKTEGSEPDHFSSDAESEPDERTRLEAYFMQSLEVDLLLRVCPDEEDTIDQIVNLLVDTCSSKRRMLRVAGDDKPAEVVRSRFMKLNVLERHCNRAKISVISVHGLRHTHASVLLFAGVSIASVARRLGHSSMTTTQKTYLHIIQELENQDIDLVMRSLSGLS